MLDRLSRSSGPKSRWGAGAAVGGGAPRGRAAGHPDVVPPGDESAWSHPPFAAEIVDGQLFGRGAVDMKSGVACFMGAVETMLETLAEGDAISLIITGDEEGPSINGTRKMLDWLSARGEVIDDCVVGEPTNPDQLGEMIKIGRISMTTTPY